MLLYIRHNKHTVANKRMNRDQKTASQTMSVRYKKFGVLVTRARVHQITGTVYVSYSYVSNLYIDNPINGMIQSPICEGDINALQYITEILTAMQYIRMSLKSVGVMMHKACVNSYRMTILLYVDEDLFEEVTCHNNPQCDDNMWVKKVLNVIHDQFARTQYKNKNWYLKLSDESGFLSVKTKGNDRLKGIDLTINDLYKSWNEQLEQRRKNMIETLSELGVISHGDCVRFETPEEYVANIPIIFESLPAHIKKSIPIDPIVGLHKVYKKVEEIVPK